MIGRAISLRLFALIFALACAIFVIISGYQALLAYSGPLMAPMAMAALSAFAALGLLGLTHFSATRRSARLRASIANLIDHKPVAALAAALVAGAAARFGIEPEDLFPIFEAFAPATQTQSAEQEPSPPTDTVSTTANAPRPHPHPPQPNVH